MISPVDFNDDWRFTLFGPSIQDNQLRDEESAGYFHNPINEAFHGYDYIALFFGANYCPHCKAFAPHVVAARDAFESKKCKTIFISNDRDEENFQASCTKVRGLDVMPYDTSRTRQMRDLFGLTTIPALIILHNRNFAQPSPEVITNARSILEQDPKLENFPWASSSQSKEAEAKNDVVTSWERIWIHGRHGKWWQLGHSGVSKLHPNDMYMDEHAVQIRAGLLNIITWLALMNVYFLSSQTLVKVLFPLVAIEFMASMVFGLTPFAPIGLLGTLLSIVFHDTPLWKPAKPKRFAWLIGLTLAVGCFTTFQLRDEFATKEAYKATVSIFVFFCNVATWLESSAGFCIGCFLYNRYVTKWFKLEECSECKI